MAGLLADQPFEWGKCDCALWVASYIEEKTGVHPAPHLVGTYDTAFGARQLVMRHGGLINLVSSFMGDFSGGDEVGVFTLGGSRICGIQKNGRQAFKTKSGMMIVRDAKILKGWNI